jgi:hypothetical protein
MARGTFLHNNNNYTNYINLEYFITKDAFFTIISIEFGLPVILQLYILLSKILYNYNEYINNLKYDINNINNNRHVNELEYRDSDISSNHLNDSLYNSDNGYNNINKLEFRDTDTSSQNSICTIIRSSNSEKINNISNKLQDIFNVLDTLSYKFNNQKEIVDKNIDFINNKIDSITNN